MSGEYPEDLPDLSDLTFAEGPDPELVEIIPSELRAVGFHTPAENEPGPIEDAAWVNWWRRQVGRALRSMGGALVRRFDTLADGITGTAPGDLFTVYPAAGLPPALGAAAVTITPTIAPTCWTVDGARLFVGRDRSGIAPRTNSLVAYPASGGAALWAALTVEDNPSQICADGAFVFVASHSGEGPTTTIEMFAAAAIGPYVAGELIDAHVVAVNWDMVAMVANGTHLAFIGTDTTAAKSQIKILSYDTGGFNPLIGTLDYSSAINEVLGVAIADTWAVAVGSDATGPARTLLKIINLANAAQICALTPATWTADDGFALNAVATDGLRIATVGRFMDPAGGTDYVSRFLWGDDGSRSGRWSALALLQSGNVNGAQAADLLSMDDGLEAHQESAAADIDTISRGDLGRHLISGGIASALSLCREACDGYLLWTWDGTYFRGLQLYREPRIYRRVSGLDPNRGPLPSRLAQPVR